MNKEEFFDYMLKNPHKAERLLKGYQYGIPMDELVIRQTGRTSREILDVIYSASVIYNEDPNEMVYYICINTNESDIIRRRINGILNTMGCLCLLDRIDVSTKREYENRKYVIISHYIKDGI